MKNIMGSDHRPGRDSKFVAGSKPIYARSRVKCNNKSITYSQNGSVYDEKNRKTGGSYMCYVTRHASGVKLGYKRKVNVGKYK